jgi:hypothetical protein
MSPQDGIALGALLLGIVSALCAFIYWLLSISYKITRFIFELRGDVSEIKQTMYNNQEVISSITRKLKYLAHVIKVEFPQYFKREEDRESEADN